ncbi:DUF7010 family protein [Bhargavaea ullalensis]|uniref:Uncharacterized protein n=1 Tax=Bhargavaea ullalensis TaxID=1265685 RepID=A0ABV2GCT0_9BACL
MDLNELRQDLALRNKNGLPFLLSGMTVWILATVWFSLPVELELQNIGLFVLSGIMFPLAVGLSSLLKTDWKSEGNPLGSLGLILNVAQFMYFPLVFWAFGVHPETMLLIFAVITGAHLFPYGWVYMTKAYYFLAPAMAIAVTVIGWNGDSSVRWLIPLTMALLLMALNMWLWLDYRKKTGIGLPERKVA